MISAKKTAKKHRKIIFKQLRKILGVVTYPLLQYIRGLQFDWDLDLFESVNAEPNCESGIEPGRPKWSQKRGKVELISCGISL